jgi:7-cyano-7-deazaguanine synthase
VALRNSSNKSEYGRPNVLVLAGGGVDSTVCIYELARKAYRVRALHVDYGQHASEREWDSVKRTSLALGIAATQINITPPDARIGAETVGRNAAFISIGLLHAKPDEHLICIGVHAGTPFSDCSTVFIEAMSRLIAEQTDSRVRLIAPLLMLKKPEIVARARDVGVPLEATYSCQQGGAVPCGRCHSCLDRRAVGC